jgi:hypothetical protein
MTLPFHHLRVFNPRSFHTTAERISDSLSFSTQPSAWSFFLMGAMQLRQIFPLAFALFFGARDGYALSTFGSL